MIDLPGQIRVLVTEHRIISRRCSCGTVTAGTAQQGVSAPVQYGPRLSAVGAYLWHGQFLSRNRTCQAMAELFGVPVSPGAVTAMVSRIAGSLGAPLEAIRQAVTSAPVAILVPLRASKHIDHQAVAGAVEPRTEPSLG